MNLWDEIECYDNNKHAHRLQWQHFVEEVNGDPQLKEHRDFVEKHVYGFGDRAFHWLWKLLVDELPEWFRFLEIGVYKGQVPSLIRLLADRTQKNAEIYGLTPLDDRSGPKGEFPKFPDTDYYEHIKNLHDHFDLRMPVLLHADSTTPEARRMAEIVAPFDVLYIDGGHEYEVVCSDLDYREHVGPGGFLLMDDSANFLNMWTGCFPGIVQVSRAVRDVLDPDPRFEHRLAIMHLRLWERVDG